MKTHESVLSIALGSSVFLILASLMSMQNPPALRDDPLAFTNVKDQAILRTLAHDSTFGPGLVEDSPNTTGTLIDIGLNLNPAVHLTVQNLGDCPVKIVFQTGTYVVDAGESKGLSGAVGANGPVTWEFLGGTDCRFAWVGRIGPL